MREGAAPTLRAVGRAPRSAIDLWALPSNSPRRTAHPPCCVANATRGASCRGEWRRLARDLAGREVEVEHHDLPARPQHRAHDPRADVRARHQPASGDPGTWSSARRPPRAARPGLPAACQHRPCPAAWSAGLKVAPTRTSPLSSAVACETRKLPRFVRQPSAGRNGCAGAACSLFSAKTTRRGERQGESHQGAEPSRSRPARIGHFADRTLTWHALRHVRESPRDARRSDVPHATFCCKVMRRASRITPVAERCWAICGPTRRDASLEQKAGADREQPDHEQVEVALRPQLPRCTRPDRLQADGHSAEDVGLRTRAVARSSCSRPARRSRSGTFIIADCSAPVAGSCGRRTLPPDLLFVSPKIDATDRVLPVYRPASSSVMEHFAIQTSTTTKTP